MTTPAPAPPIEIREVYLNATTNTIFGDSGGWIETWTRNRGQLFRSLQRKYGGCTSKMYRDAPGGDAVVVGWIFSRTDHHEGARRPYTADDRYVREVWVEIRIRDEDSGRPEDQENRS